MAEETSRGRRAPHLRWVRLRDMVSAPKAQRQFRATWAAEIAANFDLEKLGYPVVSKRGETYYVIDGQHRIAALKLFGFAPDDTVQVECYEGLSEREEAELFLGRNRQKTVDALSRFRVGVNAERAVETAVERVVRHQGLHVGPRGKGTARDAISAVSVLTAVYGRIGEAGLAKTLRIVRDAYGTGGLDGPVIDGVSLCVQRYDGTLDEDAAVAALAGAAGGLNGLLTHAEKTRAAVGQARPQCIAATVVDLYNRGPVGKKKRLAPWWKQEEKTQ